MKDNKELVRIGPDLDLPIIGCICFGLIDRGTNLLQVRPSSGCNLSCPFCSVDEGPSSETRVTQYRVALPWLLEYSKAIIDWKESSNIEIHIDGCGEPTLYPKLVELVQRFSELSEIETISMQTNGVLLDEEKVEELSDAGLTRINLSINSLEKGLAERLAGTEIYDIDEIKKIAIQIARSEIDLLIAPVWINGVNDSEIPKIIEFANRIDAGGNSPSLGIQKYQVHKRGRKMENVGPISWKKFYQKLEKIERKTKEKLVLSRRDFGIEKCKSIPKPFRKSEKVKTEVKAKGWMKGEKLGVAENRAITIVGAEDIPIGSKVKVKILENKHNLYIAKPTR